MKYSTSLLALICLVFVVSCQKKETSSTPLVVNDTLRYDTLEGPPMGDNSRVSLDWAGVYDANLPCADCPGITSELTINENGTFIIREEYQERNVVSKDSGTFAWNKSGSEISLTGKDVKLRFKVGENKLIQLDLKGQRIEGPLKDSFTYIKKQ